MDRFRFPDDLIRAQQDCHNTYRALAAPVLAVPSCAAVCSACPSGSRGIRS